MSSRRRKFTRRALIAGGGLLGCCALVPLGGLSAYYLTNRAESTIGDLDFANPLQIPPLLEGELDPDGRRVFDLTLQTGQTAIKNGTAETWGVNGSFLGPTVRASRGETVTMRVHNELPEATSIHWHGMHLPAAMDGGPHQMIAVGESWIPTWTVDQPASTLWYHPHPHGQTARHVYQGVAGLFLLDDDEEGALDLPREYGVDDIPLIIQDKQFTDDGDLTMDTTSFFEIFGGSESFGVIGDTLLVNGTWNPHLEIDRELIRFRILNGSNARFYNLGFADDRRFHLVATENGLVPGAPVELDRLLVGPGERAEIVVPFTAGERAVLRGYKADLGEAGRQIGANDSWDVLEIRAADSLATSPPLPDDLGTANAAPTVPERATERSIRFEGHSEVNGQKMDMTRIDEVVPAGAIEVWNVSSNGQVHTFHIHGATFHVLDVDGKEPEPHLRGPKDTVFISGSHPVRLAVEFAGHEDPETPYMFHCHVLRHEDEGMMGQFVVVEPGTEGSVDRTVDGLDAEVHDH